LACPPSARSGTHDVPLRGVASGRRVLPRDQRRRWPVRHLSRRRWMGPSGRPTSTGAANSLSRAFPRIGRHATIDGAAHEGVICLWVPSPPCTPGAPTATTTATRQGAHGGGSAATRAAPARSAREPARSRFRQVVACRPVGCVRRLVHHHVGPAPSGSAPPGPAPRQAAPAGPVRVAAVAVAAGPDRDGGGGDDGGGAVAVADRTYGDGAGPPWRRRHHHRACGQWRAARRPGPATACQPAVAGRHNAGAGYCQPVPGCRYRRRGWRYTCPRRQHPGGTGARYAERSGLYTPAVTIANAPGCCPACHYCARTWRVLHERAAARRARHPVPRACHQHPAAACHQHPAAACHQHPTAACHQHPTAAARELTLHRAAALRSQSMGRFLMTRFSCGHAADAPPGLAVAGSPGSGRLRTVAVTFSSD